MAWQIDCDDGAVIRGETGDELVENARAHMREHHPDLPKLTRRPGPRPGRAGVRARP